MPAFTLPARCNISSDTSGSAKELLALVKMVLSLVVAVVLVDKVKLEILVPLVVDMVVKVELEYKIILQLV